MSSLLTEYLLRGDITFPYAVRTAATTGMLEALLEGPKSSEEIAGALGLDATGTDAVLRLLAAAEVLTRDGDRWQLGAIASVMLSPERIELLQLSDLSRRVEESAAHLPAALAGHRPAYVEAYGSTFWADLASDPEAHREFHRHLDEDARVIGEALADSLSWDHVTRVVDIGGGRGAAAREIRRRVSGLTIEVLDTPETVASAMTADQGAATDGWVQFTAFDFFENEFPEADLYVLSQVLHDLADEQASALLQRLAAKMPTGAHLIVVERDISRPGRSLDSAQMNLRMFLLYRGRERSVIEVEHLARRAGMSSVGTVDLPHGYLAIRFQRAGDIGQGLD